MPTHPDISRGRQHLTLALCSRRSGPEVFRLEAYDRF